MSVTKGSGNLIKGPGYLQISLLKVLSDNYSDYAIIDTTTQF